MTLPAARPSADADIGGGDTGTDRTGVSGRRWVFAKADERTALAVMQTLGVPEIVARILAGRGIGAEAAADFLSPTLRALLPDPSRFLDMDRAAERLADAVVAGESVALFADYDVDGATSSALLARFLRLAGIEPIVYIPDRITEGYGPSGPAMRKLAGQGATLVLALDCGTTAFDALAEAKACGLDVIVVDHHVAEPRLPEVVALVNPNRLDADGAYGDLCTAGLAFLLAVAVNRVLRARGHWSGSRPEPNLTRWLDLVALGTVCDVVRLAGLNRAFVAQGLKVMAGRGNPGLAALGDVARLNAAPEGYHLGFVLGPRINAGGRIGKADLGARLLRTDDPGEAAAIAARLDELNAERRDIEAAVFAAAEAQVHAAGDIGAAVVVAGEGWHPGVVGIVASRLVERFGRPACVIALDGETGTGSGRSVAGVDLGAAVIAARQAGLLLKGGGHAMAAGFTVATAGVQDLRVFLDERIGARTGGGALTPDLRLEGVLSLRGIDLELAEALSRLAPFGPGNPEPRFALENVRIGFSRVVGQDHVQATLTGPAGAGRVDAVAFRSVGTPLGEVLLDGRDTPVHVAGRVKLDTWGGNRRAKFHIEDAAPARAG